MLIEGLSAIIFDLYAINRAEPPLTLGASAWYFPSHKYTESLNLHVNLVPAIYNFDN